MKITSVLLLAFAGLPGIFNSNLLMITPEYPTAFYTMQDTTGQSMVTKTKGYEAKTVGITFNRIETFLDSSYYPKSLYYNIRFAEILGVSLDEVKTGKLKIELFNQQKENIALVKQPRFYPAPTFKDGEQLNILFSIALNPADANNKNHTYRLTFETTTGRQLITMDGKVG